MAFTFTKADSPQTSTAFISAVLISELYVLAHSTVSLCSCNSLHKMHQCFNKPCDSDTFSDKSALCIFNIFKSVSQKLILINICTQAWTHYYCLLDILSSFVSASGEVLVPSSKWCAQSFLVINCCLLVVIKKLQLHFWRRTERTQEWPESRCFNCLSFT